VALGGASGIRGADGDGIRRRRYPGHRQQPSKLAATDPQTGERVLLVAVGDYLERSQMVLIELTNSSSKGSKDISAEQERAGDLVTETRLYRQSAARTGDTRITGVLDELERVLVDITHAPSNMTPDQLEALRQAGSRRHSLQDSRAGLQRPESGSSGQSGPRQTF
jgi:hypothetical protein